MESEDGIYWQVIEYFNGKFCTTFTYMNEHLVIGNTGNIFGAYYSDDYGETWYESENPPHLSDMMFYPGDTLYGIYQGDFDNSGIWQSQDYGASWNELYYSYMMKCIETDCEGNIFVAWGPEMYSRQEGVGIWNPQHNIVEEMNEGLPNLDVYQLTFHPLIDCIHMIACTGWGVYMLNEYQVDTGQEIIPDHCIQTSCYPNPYVYDNGSQLLRISCDDYRHNLPGEAVIYNIKGQKVKQVPGSMEGSFYWNGTDSKNALVETGVYFYRININKRSSKLKKILFMR
jgi:hypothetical protein